MSSDVHDLQQQVSKNVKVLMAITEIGTQMELAARLGWNRTVVADRFSGKRSWKLDDLNDLAAVFGVYPGELLGDTAALVGAAGKAQAANSGRGAMADATHPYWAPELASVASLSQVSALRSDETDVTRPGASDRVMLHDAA